MSVGNKILSRVLFLHLFSNILRVPMQNNNYRDSERVLWESPVCKSLLVAVKKGICERIKALFHQVTKRKEEEMVSNWKKNNNQVLTHASMLPHGDVRLCLEGLSSLWPPSSHQWQSGHHGEFGLHHVSPGSGAWMRALGQMEAMVAGTCGGHS